MSARGKQGAGRIRTDWLGNQKPKCRGRCGSLLQDNGCHGTNVKSAIRSVQSPLGKASAANHLSTIGKKLRSVQGTTSRVRAAAAT